MNSLTEIPEIKAIDSRHSLIRIPGQQDVPVTPRIRHLIDSRPFQRLNSIRQLGLVSLIYPGAVHSRFEHSLGVFRMALLFLKRLAANPRFCQRVSPEQAELMIVAALLHDAGHWPYCHPVEDMELAEVPEHEALACQRLLDSEIPEILSDHFTFATDDICELLQGARQDPTGRLLGSILSGPIDVDKMDYLYRDSLHAGVPYGMHYDRSRLIGSLCLDQAGSSLAITEKGCTAAELMVFARYVMFSEVYWHHAVRSATAMLQRAVFALKDRLDFHAIFQSTDDQFQQELQQVARGTAVESLVGGLFGGQRRLYKRMAQLTVLDHGDLFQKISRRKYDWLFRCSEHLAAALARATGQDIGSNDVLIDAPPVGLEVQFQIPVLQRTGSYRDIGDVSPVVRTLATEQFDNYVKRVRVFVSPDMARENIKKLDLVTLLEQAIEQTEAVKTG